MAFAGVISDLFNCGRPRRPQTRDGSKSGEDATRMVAVTQDGAGFDIPPTAAAVPSDTRLHAVPEDEELPRPTSVESKAPFNSRPSTRRASIEAIPADSIQHAPTEEPRSRTKRSESSDTNTKAKASIGKQVEQRFLVTIDTPASSNAPAKLSLDHVEASVVEVAPIEKKPVVEPQLVQETVTARLETPPKLAEEPPSVTVDVSTAQLPETEPIVQPQEASPVIAPAALEETVVPMPQPASTQLLDLPTEIRKLIYRHMVEEKPIRMCRHDDPALARSEPTPPPPQKRLFYSLTQVCRQLRTEFLPLYEARTEYIIDLWTQRTHLTNIGALRGKVAIDIDAACFDMQPIDILPLIRYLARTRKAGCRFASTEGVVFHSIESIVVQLNKLLPSTTGTNSAWLAAANGPMKRVDLHLFPHEDIRQYYRFRGAEPMLRIVYPSAVIEPWMKQSHKCGAEYEAYLNKTGLDILDMHIVVGHASRRTTNQGRMPLDWRLSYVGSRLSVEQAVRISGTWTR
ncbi:hypothetical protein HBI25_036000 [Parastagonospora nodorum]|nr:hypothetical protein HBI03_067570 [Parastagonospora nodorum]KAH4273389.1 hypothetical protein HBI04_137390 [Parastagonospora nodorum]KAH4305866.1 hypothetical protein HBI01_061950 [Parastagonospora nodorum]KAH4310666.1 hypothetical protein HBI02_095100 [Parastagonospora nodorum]KAH4333175.1 hypothetical protein HBI00_051270 [Parastagonospora nodorum]